MAEDEEVEDLADMMAEEDEEAPIVIKITPEEFKACQVLIRKIHKAGRLFPDDPFFKSVEYQEMDKLRLVQLQTIYQDIIKRANAGEEVELYTMAYAGAVKFTEDLLTRKVGVNVSGLTDTLMGNKSVRVNLKLIELEYGLEEQLGMEMTPARALFFTTIGTAFMVYNHNKEGGDLQPGELPPPIHQQPPPPPIIVPPPVQIQVDQKPISLQPQASDQFNASLALLDKLKGHPVEKVI